MASNGKRASDNKRLSYRGRRTALVLALPSLCFLYTSLSLLYKLLVLHDSGSIAPPQYQPLKIRGGQPHLRSTTNNRMRETALARDIEIACAGVQACISVHVFAHNRVNATKRLLETLESSDYTGYTNLSLPLVIHVDGPASRDDDHAHLDLRELAQEFRWTHGPKLLHIEDTNRGLKASWLRAWTNPRHNDMMIAFEDDINPSPLYFQWILKIVTDYQLLEADKRDPSLLGVSLSPMRVDEISYPFRPWMTHEKLSAEFPVFLHAVPSSWGAAYFGGPWRDFLEFVDVRSNPPFYDVDDAALNLTGYGWHTQRGDPNLWLPNSRSNNWVKSWKRYMVEFAYGRGAYTLYPNVGNSSGLATSTFMQGEHVPHGAYQNPRVAPLVMEKDLDLGSPLPPYDKLPLVDMHGDAISRRALGRRGDAFVGKVSRLGRHYSDLAILWGRPCLLDAVSGVQGSSSSSGHSTHTAADRYLVVAPQMGFSNQLTAVLQSAIWAHTLGRKLVLPHILWPRASDAYVPMEGWIPFHEVFDPIGVTEHLPGLELVHGEVKLLSTWQPKRVVAIEPQPMFDRLHSAYFDALGWSSIERVDFTSRHLSLTTIDKLYQRLGSCSDEVMALDGLYHDPVKKDLTEKQREQIWRSLFRPAPLVNHMIQTARKAIVDREPAGNKSTTDYACLHIRLGDFSAMCSAPQDAAPWLTNLYKRGRHCNVSVNDMIDRANSLELDTLLIISDDTEKLSPILAGIQATNVWTGTDIRAMVEDMLPPIRPHPSKQLIDVVSAVTEQHVCSQANRVVLNGFSTFSRSVLYQREKFQGVEFW